jgi:hypothetical protein
MIFKAYTLVDVTQTNARRYDAPKLVNQQANFNTFYNTIGLRTNATEFEITVEEVSIAKLGFGSNYKGKQKVWTIEFYVEAEGSTTVDLLDNDFDLVPIITNLDETVDLDKGLFITCSNHGRRNIIFEQVR